MIINKNKGTGKTTELIYISNKTKYPIIVATPQQIDFVEELAKHLHCNIPNPIYIDDFINNRLKGKSIPNKVLVDEIDWCLQSLLGIDIVDATITVNKDIELNQTTK